MSHLFYLDECASTNDEILNFKNLESFHLSAVYTFNQTNGRGQYGNLWKCQKNLNIAFSIAIREENVKTSFSIFNYYTALIIRDFIANLTKIDTKIKWPNDLIIKNKKICGMLIERKKNLSDNYFIVGIGINVLQKDFTEFAKAGSLLTQTDHFFDLHEIAKQLFEFLSERFSKPVISESEILKKYNAELFKRSEVGFFETKGVRQNGIIQHADENGFLWINLENDGLQKFYYKEIEMIY